MTNEEPDIEEDTHVKELQVKISDLESRIAKACNEEKFEVAGEYINS